MKETTVMVSGQTPARGGQEIARRREPTVAVAVRPSQVVQPGYDSQPQANQFYRQKQIGSAPPQY